MKSSMLRRRLQEISGEKYAQLQVVERKAYQLLEYVQAGGNIKFTPHGYSHVSGVEKNYDWILLENDIDHFNASEIFCLLVATFFHDALMLPKKLGDEDNARAMHIDRAHDFLLQKADSLGISVHEADAISEVIKGHGIDNLNEIREKVVLGTERVELRKLAACLSLADITHADSSRAPEIVFRHLELNEDSKYHWRRHLQISGITRQDDSIIMSALVFSAEGENAVAEYRQYIEDQLNIIKPYFNSILTPLKRVELSSNRLDSPLQQTLQFEANTPAILKLLIEGVYDRVDVFVRELVQNSLDSCLIRSAKLKKRNDPYKPQIVLTLFKDKKSYVAFRVDDNGVGMDIHDVQDTLLWIGSSISTDTEINALLHKAFNKNLIATFGIGLLSCFKASDSISIRTAKENSTSLEISLTGISDNINPQKSSDSSVGTTIIVKINDEKNGAIDLKETIIRMPRSSPTWYTCI